VGRLLRLRPLGSMAQTLSFCCVMLAACCMVDRCFCLLPWIFPTTASHHVRCCRRDRRLAKRHFSYPWVGLEHAAVHGSWESMWRWGKGGGGLITVTPSVSCARRPHGARLTVRGKQEGAGYPGRRRAWQITVVTMYVRHRAQTALAVRGGALVSELWCHIAAGVSCRGIASEGESAS
jgi:hypothetical protein